MESVVEVAAWVIVGEAARRFFKWRQQEKHLELERSAVRMEFHSSKTQQSRRQELLTRYPHYLIEAPSAEQFAKAAQNNAEWRELMGTPLWVRIGQVVIVSGGIGIGYLIKWAFHQFFSAH